MALRAANRGEEARRELAAVDAEARRLGFARVADRARATVAAK
jgi:hypothetical protein